MLHKLMGGLLALTLFGCAALPQMPSDKRDTIEKPEHHFKSSMTLTLEGKSFPGFAATKLSGPITFTASSKVDLNHVIIESCHRDYLVKPGGKSFTWTFKPLPVEMACKSALIIKSYDENGLTDWGLIAFRSDETLPTSEFGVECNGVRWTFAGYTVCNHKRDKPQRIAFDVPVQGKAQPQCHMTRLDEKSFELRPELGECSAVFTDGKDWHTALFVGFEREFLR